MFLRAVNKIAQGTNKRGIKASDVGHHPHLPHISILLEPREGSGSIVAVHIVGDVFIPQIQNSIERLQRFGI